MNQKKYDVLLVEDNEEQIKAFLDNTPPNIHLFAVATTYKEYLKMVNEEKWDFIITDLFFPYSEDPKENETMNKDFWGLVLKNSLKYHIGDNCMRGFRFWENDYQVNSPEEKEMWHKLHAHEMLSPFEKVGFENLFRNYFGSKNFPEKETAPWGFEVFTDLYFRRNLPVVLQTSDHAHSNIGSPILMLMQHFGLDCFQHIPFLSLNGHDPRLHQIQKPSDIKNIEKILYSGMISSKLKNFNHYEMNCIMTAIITLDWNRAMTINDLIENGFSEDEIFERALEIQEKRIMKTQNRTWDKENIGRDIEKIKAKIEEIKRQGAHQYVFNFFKKCLNATLREYYEGGINLLKRERIFPPTR